MPVINLKAMAQCAGGDHLTIRTTVGAQQRFVLLSAARFAEEITEEDWESLTRLLLRVYKSDKTLAQVKTGLLGVLGVDVVVP